MKLNIKKERERERVYLQSFVYFSNNSDNSVVHVIQGLCLCFAGASEASFLEIPALTCTCVVATFFWFLLTLFIRKLRQVNRNVEVKKYSRQLLVCYVIYFLHFLFT